MLRYARPAEPDNFAEKTADAKATIEEMVEDGVIPPSKNFKDVWKDFKGHLLLAQYDHCGYCEQRLSVHPADVEHYHPKAMIQSLPADKALQGAEDKDGTYGVKGRRLIKEHESGYWWLAYDWHNYLAACNRCNSGWKRNLFPVDRDPRTLPPTEDAPDPPLLLNPFESADPALHLEYGPLGDIKPHNHSRFGLATIQTCGLDRGSLYVARYDKASKAHEHVRRYRASSDTNERKGILRDLVLEGSERGEFPGMVRTIYTQELRPETGQTWEELVAKVILGKLQDWAESYFENSPRALAAIYHGEIARQQCHFPGGFAEVLLVIEGDADAKPDPDRLVTFPVPVPTRAQVLTREEVVTAWNGNDQKLRSIVNDGRILRDRPGWRP